MEADGLLPRSQEPATRPYPQPIGFRPHPNILFHEDSFHYVGLYIHLHIFPSDFPTQMLHHFLISLMQDNRNLLDLAAQAIFGQEHVYIFRSF
jgi:hypothetical protein